MKTIIKTADEVINDIAEVLSQASGEFIEEIANKVLTVPVKYNEDSEDSEFEVGVIETQSKEENV
jgi:hypothetical protein